MKKVLILAMIPLVFNSFSFASQSASQPSVKNQHIYVDADKVKITKKGLFLSVDNDVIPIPCVFSDQKGFFIKEIQLKNLPEYQTKRIHQCLCHNPDCPRENRLFIATEWRPFCSDRCEYEAIASGHPYYSHRHHHRHR
jgi:hypothetical protein